MYWTVYNSIIFFFSHIILIQFKIGHFRKFMLLPDNEIVPDGVKIEEMISFSSSNGRSMRAAMALMDYPFSIQQYIERWQLM